MSDRLSNLSINSESKFRSAPNPKYLSVVQSNQTYVNQEKFVSQTPIVESPWRKILPTKMSCTDQ